MTQNNKKNLFRLSQKFLQGLGEHEETGAFTPSPFQIEAVDAVMQRDTVVDAPTGSGKTYIAVEAMRHYLMQGELCWYTTPLKALSNQKLVQFQRIFGGENVGLVTGERQENRTAPIMIATTEILRNVLYEGAETPAFVVLDEAHYLGDQDRGTAWEEIMILAPRETRFLLLSATIPNARELCDWMASIRGHEPALVECTERPVPLRFGVLDTRRIPLPLSEHLSPPSDGGRQSRSKKLPKLYPLTVLHVLDQNHLLPSIVFLPTRKKCDEWTREFNHSTAKGMKERKELLEEMMKIYPQLNSHSLQHIFVHAGVAPHHAGHLTPWRILIEHALDRGLLRAVFATTTLAAGLDVPARTVILTQLWRHDSYGREDLSGTEFHQMTGRAGRRGKDKVGFVIILPEKKDDYAAARALSEAEANPLRSAFRMHYFQLLNLLARFSLDEVKTFFLEKSFFAFQRAKSKEFRRDTLMREFMNRAGLLRELGYLDENFKLAETGRWAKGIRHECALYITENLRRGRWEELSPEHLCAACAVFISQRTGKPTDDFRRWKGEDISDVIKEVRHVKRRECDFKINSEEYLDLKNFFDIKLRAQSVYAWAGGMEWEKLCSETGLWEGDLQRLMLQTEELLHQISDLPLAVADAAKNARALLLRPPVA